MTWTKREILFIVLALIKDFVIDGKELVKNSKEDILSEYIRRNLLKPWNSHDYGSTRQMVQNIIFELKQKGIENTLTQYVPLSNSDIIAHQVVESLHPIFQFI